MTEPKPQLPFAELAEAKRPAVVNHIDILRNPVFRVDDRRLSKDGERSDIAFEVNGRVRVRVEKAELTSVEGQVLPALLSYAAKEKFQHNRVEFFLADFLRFMEWYNGGPEYLRLAEAVRRLYEAEVTIYQPSKRRWVKTRFIHTHSFLDVDANPALLFRRTGSEKDFVEFTDEFCRLWRTEIPDGKANFKALHPDYFSLTTRVQQRLVEIFSVYASDLNEWEPELFWLRDNIPLHGQTYRYASAVKRALKKPLANLVERGFVEAHEWRKKDKSSEWLLWLKLNPAYYYSVPPSTARKTLSEGGNKSKAEAELTQAQQGLLEALRNRGVSPQEATRFVLGNEAAFIERKLDHLDFELDRGKANDPGAFLSSAIRGKWTEPEGFAKWRKGKVGRQKKQAKAIAEAQAKAGEGSFIVAVELAEKALKLGRSSELENLLGDIRPKAEMEREAQTERDGEIEKRVDELLTEATEDEWGRAMGEVSARSDFERKMVQERGRETVVVKFHLRSILRKKAEAELGKGRS